MLSLLHTDNQKSNSKDKITENVKTFTNIKKTDTKKIIRIFFNLNVI